MFIVGSDLDEAQRESLTSSHSLRNTVVTAYTLDRVQTLFGIFLHAEKLIGESVSPRERQWQQPKQNIHC